MVKHLVNNIRLTSSRVEEDIGEQKFGGCGNELVSLENISEVIVVEFVRVPDQGETTTDQALISVEADDGVVVADVVWGGEEVHLTVDGNIALGTVPWEVV